MAAVGVAIRVEISDRDPDQVGRSNERLREGHELVPVEPAGLRIADGGQDALVENVKVEM